MWFTSLPVLARCEESTAGAAEGVARTDVDDALGRSHLRTAKSVRESSQLNWGFRV
jgi:hypothetical protein